MHQYVLLQVGVVHQLGYRVVRPVENVVVGGFAGSNGHGAVARTQGKLQEFVSSGGPVEVIMRVGGFQKDLQRGIIVAAYAAIDEFVRLGLSGIVGDGNRLGRKVSGSGRAGAHDLPQRQVAIVGEIFALRVVGEKPGRSQRNVLGNNEKICAQLIASERGGFAKNIFEMLFKRPAWITVPQAFDRKYLGENLLAKFEIEVAQVGGAQAQGKSGG